VADADLAAAEQFGARFEVTNLHQTVESLLDASDLDVLHVATPPAMHLAHGLAAVERRVNVLIEKPIALTSVDVEELYKRAAENNVSVCPDFIQLFHPKMEQALTLVESGTIGRPVHVEAHLGTDGSLGAIRDLPKLHWSWTLPGGILHNYLSHPLYLALRFTGEPKSLSVAARSQGALPQSLTDHLAVLIDGEKCTANVVLSMVTKPERYYIEIFGESGVVFVDFDTMNITVRRKMAGPRTISRLARDPMTASQLIRGTAETIIGYARKKVVPYQGLRGLLARYYGALLDGGEPPITKALAVATSRAEESIFAAVGPLHLDLSRRPSRQTIVRTPESVLVTGASGYLGREVCRQLVENGVKVRALVRPVSTIAPLEKLGVELLFGDMRDAHAVNCAAQGVGAIVHLAALLHGSAEAIRSSSVLGLENVARAARAANCRRVIYVSSFSIYDYSRLRKGDRIDEESPLEPFPAERGVASEAKCRAEEIAAAHLADESQCWTILRPTFIVGNGRNPYHAIGYKVGSALVVIGSRGRNLKLIHVSDVAAAIRIALDHDGTKGRVFTLSDGRPLTAADYVAHCVPGDSRIIYLPYWVVRAATAPLRALHAMTGRGPSMNLRRLGYRFNDTKADSRSFTEATGWRPEGNLLERLARDAGL
jgi:predicted dehydrogenase/nucleoside-diphosphate-sugar epimerase